jgi:hypothetical protein
MFKNYFYCLTITLVFSLVFSIAYAEDQTNDIPIKAKIKKKKKKKKKFDIRFSPLVLAIGAIDTEFNYKVAKKVTVGPMLRYFNAKDILGSGIDLGLSDFGVRSYFNFNGAFKDGFYVSAFIRYAIISLKTADAEADLTKINMGASLGYLWQWSYVNFAIGVGYQANFNEELTLKTRGGGGEKETIKPEDSDITKGLVLDFALGVSF